MKVAALSLALLGSTQAFAPSRPARSFAGLRMEEEGAEAEEAAPEPEPEPAPAPVAKAVATETPFGTAPLMGSSSIYLGQREWEAFTTKVGSEDTGTFLRAAEIKHGRSAMIATVGFAFQKLGVTFDDFTPHEYLSVTQGVKFSDLEAMGPFEAVSSIPLEGICQIFMTIAAIEIYELTHKDGKFFYFEDKVAPGWQSGGMTGDLGWNPLKITVDDRRRLVEIQNGRAAMFAISGWVANELFPGSFPLPLPW